MTSKGRIGDKAQFELNAHAETNASPSLCGDLGHGACCRDATSWRPSTHHPWTDVGRWLLFNPRWRAPHKVACTISRGGVFRRKWRGFVVGCRPSLAAVKRSLTRWRCAHGEVECSSSVRDMPPRLAAVFVSICICLQYATTRCVYAEQELRTMMNFN